MTYYKLLDRVNRGTVVRAEGENQQKHTAARGWVDSGIMIQYFCDESPVYDMYEEITKEEMQKLTGGE